MPRALRRASPPATPQAAHPYQAAALLFLRAAAACPAPLPFQTALARTPQNKEDLENEGVFPTTEDYEIYFNPSESIGTSHSNPDNETGIGNTITISNPGAGDSTRIIPRGSIFLPNHNLITGDVVNYELNGVSGSETAPKVKFFSATPTVDTTVGIGTSLFVIKKTDDLIGLSTVKVGIGSTGVRFGLGLTGTQPVFEEIQFLDVGIGSIHSLRLKNSDTISGSITRNLVTAVGTGTHGLKNNDIVFEKQKRLFRGVFF